MFLFIFNCLFVFRQEKLESVWPSERRDVQHIVIGSMLGRSNVASPPPPPQQRRYIDPGVF